MQKRYKIAVIIVIISLITMLLISVQKKHQYEIYLKQENENSISSILSAIHSNNEILKKYDETGEITYAELSRIGISYFNAESDLRDLQRQLKYFASKEKDNENFNTIISYFDGVSLFVSMDVLHGIGNYYPHMYNDEIIELGKDEKLILGYINKEEKSHTIKFRYFNKDDTGSGTDLLTKDLNYGVFKIGENTFEIYEGNVFLDMVAEDISVLYYCKENSPDELARIKIKFDGEVTLTGKLDVTVDEEFGYQVYFIVDSENINKLPHHVEDTRDSGEIRFVNDNLKEILGEESFSRDCEITIKDFNIHYAATEATNTAELISVRYIE